MTPAANIERCPSCGAPFIKKLADDMPQEGRDRCAGCYHADGTPKSQEELVAALATYLSDALDLGAAAARQIASERIGSLPAWAPRQRRR